MSEGTTSEIVGTADRPGQAVELALEESLAPSDFRPAPGLLPGELSPHPSPFKYVMIAVILVVITAVEIGTSYLEGDIPDGLIVTLLIGMAHHQVRARGGVLHAPEDRPADLPPVLHPRARRRGRPVHDRPDDPSRPRELTGAMVVAAGFPPGRAHPDVWLLVAALVVGYAVAVQRLGPSHAPDRAGPSSRRFQVVCFAAGRVHRSGWPSDWPIHDVAEKSMYSVHMVQHLMFSMVATPLLLLGTPAWLLRWILRPPSWLYRVVRWMARFVPALIVYNLVLVFTHWPALVDRSIGSAALHFSLHTLLFVSSLLVWLPILSPLPEIPRLSPLMRAIYLFVWSVVPTVPASFLTFGDHPLYRVYEHLPKLWGVRDARGSADRGPDHEDRRRPPDSGASSP